MARHRYDLLWLSRHGVVGTASTQFRNVCKQIVYACRTMSGRPDKAGRIFTHLSQIVYKLLEVVRPSRQDVVYLYKMCGLVRPYRSSRRSEQLVATGRATGSPRLLFQPCRAIIMPYRGATCHDTYVTSELYCIQTMHLNIRSRARCPRLKIKGSRYIHIQWPSQQTV